MPKKKDSYGACCGTIIGNQAKRIKELEKELRETKDELRKAKAKPRDTGRHISMLVMDEFVPGEKMAAEAEALKKVELPESACIYPPLPSPAPETSEEKAL